ncbi:RagB/SusD family nutrient uptake outer membrane protein [Chitinophaga sp. RAB17]|uniref:RagB/SusD family nutrient uptake outer membrane protein n=1 Tax=Chitinophaga sp. RAB17 TaxID=3233049 RepID=UPI003F93AEFD
MKPINWLILFTISTLVFTSCKKFLDQDPDSQATDQTTWKSEGDANSSVAACYSLLRSALNASITHYAYGDLPTDEFNSEFVTGGADNSFKKVAGMQWEGSVPPANSYVELLKLRVYSNFYTTIAQANRCLHFLNLMPAAVFAGSDAAAQQAKKNQYIGEAYFVRAFAYFYMSRVWGDVPLVTSYYPDVATAPQVARSPQKDILAQCVADLTLAKQYLPWKDNNSADKIVRGDKGNVFALMAHIYAWKSSYDSCRMACDSVISSGSYSLVPASDYLSIYKGQSPEGIFEISNNQLKESLVAAQSISGQTLASPYINNITVPLWQLNTGVVNTLFYDTTDIRFKKSFVTIATGTTSFISCIKYSNIQYIDPSKQPQFTVAQNNIIIFRLADIKLLKAEAMAAGTNPDFGGALSIVNEIRSRAGLTKPLTGITGRPLLDTITAERGRELFLEGHRFYDLVRLARNTGVVKFPFISTGEFAAGKYYWPLDPSLFLTNSKLVQTPFWQGKLK